MIVYYQTKRRVIDADDGAGALLHLEAVLSGVFALRDDQPRGGVLHPRRCHV